jgi:outer membrane receptor protein involved in Fe transport
MIGALPCFCYEIVIVSASQTHKFSVGGFQIMLTTSRRTLFGTTILAGLMAVASPSFAQQTTGATQVDDVSVNEVSEIVVTGSRIRRDPTNAPTPLITVGREQLLDTGLPTVIDYLATIPALSNSLVPSDTTGSLNLGGVSAANLRTLGTSRVLTLIDGRRQVGASVGQLLVDVDTIPRLLIENIEIITGGASSVYGADAVSGVLNYNLRKDFEGLEIDANVGQLSGDSSDAPLTRRVSILGGKNLFDDRLNIYGFGEYEKIDEIVGADIGWLRDGRQVLGVDADPTSAAFGLPSDGIIDQALFYDLRYVGRPRWGVTVVANSQQPSALSNPNVPLANCTGFTSANCYSIDPAKTYWYEDGAARLINLGTRVGNTGINRPFNIGGDGDNYNTSFSGFSRTPESESARFQAGANFKISNSITAYVEAKYVDEQTFLVTQPSFFDVYISNSYSALAVQPILGSSSFATRIDDNAFLPAIVRAALQNNQVATYGAPTATAPGGVTATATRNYARHAAFGIDRTQENERQLQRYVAALHGSYDQVGFIKSMDWDLSYTYGKMENYNQENGMDILRTSLALDAVVDTLGAVNGQSGQVVCRAQLLAAQGRPVANYNPSDPRAAFAATDPEVADCAPLNVFGEGNQSPEAIDYISASIFLDEKNEQHNFVATTSGLLWDMLGAGPMGYAVGYEYRKEMAEGLGRSASTNGRYLQLNTGGDFLPSEYEANEGFAEISIPLLQDSPLGQFAELSGSYRYFDYSNVGDGDVYGVNLVYRPIQDITFKTSYNTSFRAPGLSETNSPLNQTFANGFVDPCDTRQITSSARTAEERTNRIANCTALATARGLTYDFAGTTASTTDDYLPTYSSGIAGVNGGNPELMPETSTSFTFSTVFQPRFVPNFSAVLDYYEIEIDDVIQSVSAQVLANQCVDGPALNTFACDRIFRSNPNTGDVYDVFKVGAVSGDPIGGFIAVPQNYAKREVRGLDFKARYSLDTAEMFGRDFGQLSFDLGGSWLIAQKNFTDITRPDYFVESAASLYYPRVRFTARTTWQPTEALALTWTTDWQSAQNIQRLRDFVSSGNTDSRPLDTLDTGNFARNDFAVRYQVRDDLLLRAGVTNVFDESQAPWLGSTLYSNFDPYGRRFYVGLAYTAF